MYMVYLYTIAIQFQLRSVNPTIPTVSAIESMCFFLLVAPQREAPLSLKKMRALHIQSGPQNCADCTMGIIKKNPLSLDLIARRQGGTPGHLRDSLRFASIRSRHLHRTYGGHLMGTGGFGSVYSMEDIVHIETFIGLYEPTILSDHNLTMYFVDNDKSIKSSLISVSKLISYGTSLVFKIIEDGSPRSGGEIETMKYLAVKLTEEQLCMSSIGGVLDNKRVIFLEFEKDNKKYTLPVSKRFTGSIIHVIKFKDVASANASANASAKSYNSYSSYNSFKSYSSSINQQVIQSKGEISGIKIEDKYLGGFKINKFSPTELLTMVESITIVLDAMHQNNLIHGDVKPENIFFERTTGAFTSFALGDFGLCQKIDDQVVYVNNRPLQMWVKDPAFPDINTLAPKDTMNKLAEEFYQCL